MAFEVSYNLENEQQFWDELDDIVSTRCHQHQHEIIDNALRSFLNVTTNYRSEYLQTEYSVAKCVYQLSKGPLFTQHTDYVRRQIIYCLLQEDDNPTLHIVAAFLLFDGRNNQSDATFEMMHDEGVFPRLIELIQAETVQEEPQLHRMFLELLYESSRILRLKLEDFNAIGDAFILYLLGIIEGVSDDADDPYHYPVIRVLLVLNEQYLVASTHQRDGRSNVTNRVIKAISTHGTTYKTFGCNLILLLNRESETSLQLLILKALYLIFGNTQTAEYFYTNDLHVLVDVILRNLMDLPADSPAANALRHTYLRVLHPILMHSQISKPPFYKQEDISQILNMLITSGTHFAPVDETTQRLVKRCTDIPWLRPPIITRTDTNGSGSGVQSPVEPAAGDGQKELARRMLGMSVDDGGASTTSVLEVASHIVEPGVKTPSRGKDTA
ncbi:hypothetical protein GRF29_103g394900 [Pseudopithomyces chartarum]|uniref:SPIN90/Ldb17 leucine-rich domain-containing protein n=1 Tax=Pseudopithomyces chartarum TaxID=1892770 RepID=A0AAN6LU14_9PLEO|nr:hypothetical protein GRF29_103g394900 [Pseudopithomyces chartarum]